MTPSKERLWSGARDGSDRPVIVAARRTPIGTAGGVLRSIPVDRLAAPVLRAVADDAGIVNDDSPNAEIPSAETLSAETMSAGTRIADVVLGNVLGPGGNPARVAALTAGFGLSVPGLTVDRQCASGLAAVAVGAGLISGGSDFVVAGGAESVSTAPWRAERPASPTDPPRFYGRARFAPAEFGDPEMGAAADLVTAEAGIDRRRQDEYAARSHALAVESRAAGIFEPEIVSIGGIRHDERPRKGMTAERLGRLPATFSVDGTVTAGNSCGINDGAAVVGIASERWRAERGLAGLRIVDGETVGGDPRRPGVAPVPAVVALLRRNRLSAGDLAVLEINEAFAGQVLACLDALDISPERTCPQGGAIALGHPWGASGAVLLVRLFSQLVATGRDGEYGLAVIASGGGLGVAMLVQSVPGTVGRERSTAGAVTDEAPGWQPSHNPGSDRVR